MSRKLIKRQPKAKQLTLDSGCTAIYIRVSTDKQVDEGYSLDDQQNRLTQYCQVNDWTLCADHIYIDRGESGTTTDRADFQRMLEAARTGQIKRIVAIKLDRIARNVRAFLALVDELQALGCDLVLLKEQFNTGTPHGRFALTMFAAMAELEASTITERVMSGKHEKARTGGYNGARCPLGYTYQDGAFTINDQAHTVRAIFDRFVTGQSFSQIAAWLNETNTPTATGRGSWYPAGVRYIVSNGFYAGLSQWDGVMEQPGQHPAIVDLATYENAHRRIETIKPGPQRHTL